MSLPAETEIHFKLLKQSHKVIEMLGKWKLEDTISDFYLRHIIILRSKSPRR